MFLNDLLIVAVMFLLRLAYYTSVDTPYLQIQTYLLVHKFKPQVRVLNGSSLMYFAFDLCFTVLMTQFLLKLHNKNVSI